MKNPFYRGEKKNFKNAGAFSQKVEKLKSFATILSPVAAFLGVVLLFFSIQDPDSIKEMDNLLDQKKYREVFLLSQSSLAANPGNTEIFFRTAYAEYFMEDSRENPHPVYFQRFLRNDLMSLQSGILLRRLLADGRGTRGYFNLFCESMRRGIFDDARMKSTFLSEFTDGRDFYIQDMFCLEMAFRKQIPFLTPHLFQTIQSCPILDTHAKPEGNLASGTLVLLRNNPDDLTARILLRSGETVFVAASCIAPHNQP